MPEEVKWQIQRAILPIIAAGARDGSFIPIGTGFLICVIDPRRAVMVSAAHNFQEICRIDRPYTDHHPTTLPQFQLEIPHKDLRHTKILAGYRHMDGAFHFAEVYKTYINNPGDISVSVVHFTDEIPADVIFASKLAVDTTPPVAGTEIIAAGYSNMDARVQVGLEQATAIYSQRLEWRRGQIRAAYSNCGPRNQPWPCFQCDTPFDSGMSGGPVLKPVRQSNGDLLLACGVICSDSSSDPSSTGSGSGLDAIASMLWPAMGISIKDAEVDGVQRPVKLLELQRAGLIDDRGNASDHIRFIPGDSADRFSMAWR